MIAAQRRSRVITANARPRMKGTTRLPRWRGRKPSSCGITARRRSGKRTASASWNRSWLVCALRRRRRTAIEGRIWAGRCAYAAFLYAPTPARRRERIVGALRIPLASVALAPCPPVRRVHHTHPAVRPHRRARGSLLPRRELRIAVRCATQCSHDAGNRLV